MSYNIETFQITSTATRQDTFKSRKSRCYVISDAGQKIKSGPLGTDQLDKIYLIELKSE